MIIETKEKNKKDIVGFLEHNNIDKKYFNLFKWNTETNKAYIPYKKYLIHIEFMNNDISQDITIKDNHPLLINGLRQKKTEDNINELKILNQFVILPNKTKVKSYLEEEKKYKNMKVLSKDITQKLKFSLSSSLNIPKHINNKHKDFLEWNRKVLLRNNKIDYREFLSSEYFNLINKHYLINPNQEIPRFFNNGLINKRIIELYQENRTTEQNNRELLKHERYYFIKNTKR